MLALFETFRTLVEPGGLVGGGQRARRGTVSGILEKKVFTEKQTNETTRGRT